MLMVYVVQYDKNGAQLHAEPIRGHTMRSEAERTKRNHEVAMTRAPGVKNERGEYALVEIREEP